MKDATVALLEAERLLRKYGFAAQADLVHAGLEAIRTRGADGYRELAAPEWWSGQNSIAETYLYKEGESFTVGQEKDNRALRAALMTVVDALRSTGLATEAAEAWADPFNSKGTPKP